jgi:hypothetical protein
MMLSGRCYDCTRRWAEHGSWPLSCPFCGSLRVRRYRFTRAITTERWSCR